MSEIGFESVFGDEERDGGQRGPESGKPTRLAAVFILISGVSGKRFARLFARMQAIPPIFERQDFSVSLGRVLQRVMLCPAKTGMKRESRSENT